MRRGCLSVGTVNCDICKHHIPYPDRYVMVDEDAKGHEVETGGKSVRYCIDCALKKGYAHHKDVKGEMMLTFLRESESTPSTATPPPAAAEATAKEPAKSEKEVKAEKPAKAEKLAKPAKAEKPAKVVSLAKAPAKEKAPAKAKAAAPAKTAEKKKEAPKAKGKKK